MLEDARNLSDYFKFIKTFIPYAFIILKYKNMPYEKFLEKFKNAELRNVLKSLMNFVNDYPTLIVFLIFAYKYRYRVVPYLGEARRQREFIHLFSNAVF